METFKEDFDSYDAVFVVDDDIVIGTLAINQLFRILYEDNLLILQPAFDASSVISHPITKVDRNCLLRYSSFIENCVPLFCAKALKKVMKNFPVQLTGLGSRFLLPLGVR